MGVAFGAGPGASEAAAWAVAVGVAFRSDRLARQGHCRPLDKAQSRHHIGRNRARQSENSGAGARFEAFVATAAASTAEAAEGRVG